MGTEGTDMVKENEKPVFGGQVSALYITVIVPRDLSDHDKTTLLSSRLLNEKDGLCHDEITWVFLLGHHMSIHLHSFVPRHPPSVLVEFKRTTRLRERFDGVPWNNFMRAVGAQLSELYPGCQITVSVKEIEVREMINLT